MSPNAIWLCCVLAASLILAWAWRSAAREDQIQFQQTAADAARRTEDDVLRDLAKARSELDLTTCLAIWNITPHDIPTQRRTEEDQ